MSQFYSIRWPKYWSFSFSISPSNEYPGLTSFRMDWLDLLAVQGTLKSLLQHHSSKASILRHSALFRVQLSHPYMTTGKTIALTRRTFVGKIMSLLLNVLSRLVITFLPRSKRLLISWLQSPSAVILEPQKRVCHCIVSPSIYHEVMGPDVFSYSYAIIRNHFLIRLWCAMKNGLYMTTCNNQLNGWTEKKLQSPSQSQICTKKGHGHCLVVCCRSDSLQFSESKWNHYSW